MIEEKEGFHQLFQSEPLQQGIHGPRSWTLFSSNMAHDRVHGTLIQQRSSKMKFARRSIDFLQQKREEEAELLANEIKARWIFNRPEYIYSKYEFTKFNAFKGK